MISAAFLSSYPILILATLNKYMHILYNCIYDTLDNTVVYTVQHAVGDPFKKTYWLHALPCVKTTVDYNNLSIHINVGNLPNRTSHSGDLFYHNTVIHNRKWCYFIYSHPRSKKTTSDFQLMSHLSFQIGDLDVTHYLSRLYSDFHLTADHVCSVFKTNRGTSVVAITHDMDEIIFKDTDRVN